MKLCGAGLHDLDIVAYIVPSTGWRTCGPCQLAKARLRSKKWRAANPARARVNSNAWRLQFPLLARAAYHAWAKEHPAAVRRYDLASKRRRRARIANVLATLTAAEWEAILEAAGHSCIYCGSKKQLTQDHLTPISRGGNHTTENVAPACGPCNSSKGTKTVAEFLAEA